MPLVLEHEEDNEFDSNAIIVRAGKVKIGYVPREFNSQNCSALDTNADLLALIDIKWTCKARLISINKNNPTWASLVMEIVLTPPRVSAQKTKKAKVLCK